MCRALVDEINYSISQVDPKQKVQVGSFRVDSKGNQKTYEVFVLVEFYNLFYFKQIN